MDVPRGSIRNPDPRNSSALLPWNTIKRSIHYPLSHDGIDKEVEAHATNTIYLCYMEQGPSIEKETSSNKNNSR
jgi:hypothetical protein